MSAVLFMLVVWAFCVWAARRMDALGQPRLNPARFTRELATRDDPVNVLREEETRRKDG